MKVIGENSISNNSVGTLLQIARQAFNTTNIIVTFYIYIQKSVQINEFPNLTLEVHPTILEFLIY